MEEMRFIIEIYHLVGNSLFPAVNENVNSLHEFMYWEHQDNRAIRWGNWKTIRDEKEKEKEKEWELYDVVVKDRTECFNIAAQYPDVVNKLVKEWNRWVHANFVLPKH